MRCSLLSHFSTNSRQGVKAYPNLGKMSMRRGCIDWTRGQNNVEELWRQFFSDPSSWWDHRTNKVNPKFPDFKHKETGVALWITSKWNPSWVKAELASLAPGSVPRSLYSWNSLLSGCLKSDREQEALKVFELMQADGVKPDSFTFVRVLHACARLGALEEGRRVHGLVIQSGYESDVFVGSTLVTMYAKCGSIDDAWTVFHRMPTRNLVSWTSMLAGCVKCEEEQRALELFGQMRTEAVEPDTVTFVVVLNACANLMVLDEGRRIHAHVIQSGCESDLFVGSTLVDMYAKCGRIEEAWRVFQKMPTRNLVSWTAMLGGYVKCEEGHRALELFGQMQAEGIQPNTVTFVVLLNSCASLMALEEGRHAHAQIIQSGFDNDIAVVNTMVHMYAKCGSIDDAWRVFQAMPTRDVVSWNAMLTGYVKCDEGQKALELFRQMQYERVKLDLVTFVVVLNACASLMALEEGRHVHAQIIKSGYESEVFVGSTLVDMYAKCGSIEDAWGVFQSMPFRNLVSWTAMLTACVKCEEGTKALELYTQMQAEGVKPNPVSLVMVLNACASLFTLDEGQHAHAQVIQNGWDSDVSVGNALLDMYAKCGSMQNAWRVFQRMPTRNRVSWNSILAGCVKSEERWMVLELFGEMEAKGVEPDAVTFVLVINACASLVALEEGRLVHTEVVRNGCESDVYVGSALVDMYAKCGSIEDAWRVFNRMPVHNVVCCNAMLGGLAMHGHGKEAVKFFEEMYREGTEMNDITFVCLLSACSHAGLVEEGIQHFESMSSAYGILPTATHYACVVDLLGRAGRLDEAENMVNVEPKIIEDCTVLMALLGACRNHGHVEMGQRIAQRVLKFEPDNAAGFVLLSNIYSAAGQLDSREKRTQLETLHIRLE